MDIYAEKKMEEARRGWIVMREEWRKKDQGGDGNSCRSSDGRSKEVMDSHKKRVTPQEYGDGWEMITSQGMWRAEEETDINNNMIAV